MKARPGRLVAVVCAAQVLVQLGAGFWPALLPDMMRLWTLTNSEAGWITAIFFGAYMVSVPVLVTLTDRVDAKLIYMFGVGCTVVGHACFALFAEGFWSALALRSASIVASRRSATMPKSVTSQPRRNNSSRPCRPKTSITS